jgi:hypothetical protein
MNSINQFWNRITTRSFTDDNNIKLKAKVRINILSDSEEPENYDLHQDIWIRCMKQIRLERLQHEIKLEPEKMLETSNNSNKMKRTISNPKMKKNDVFMEGVKPKPKPKPNPTTNEKTYFPITGSTEN